MKFQCIKTTQAGIDIYVGVAAAGDLVDQAKVDVWTPDNPTGYQRALADRRISEVLHYLANADGVFPSSVLLSYRGGDARFRPEAANGLTTVGTLSLENDEQIFIIDGQHRLAGLKRAINDDSDFKGYQVPFTMIINPDVFDEARWFYLVNSKSKRVPIDLAEQLLAEAAERKGEDWLRTSEAPDTSTRGDQIVIQARLVNLVKKLGEMCPVWQGHIVLPGERATSKEDAKAHTVITSMTRGGTLSDRNFVNALEHSVDDLARVLSNFWEAVAARWPVAIDNGKDYSLRGTQGLYSLHAIFPDVLALCREDRDYSKEHIASLLNNIANDDAFWSRDDEVGHALTRSTSMAILRKLARHLRKQLPDIALPGF